MLALTTGTGHNGTHTLHEIMSSAGVKSIHEPYKRWNVYETRNAEYHRYSGKGLVSEWPKLIRAAKRWKGGRKFCHIASNNLTLLGEDLAKHFNIRFILPIKRDKKRLIMSLMFRGSYEIPKEFLIRPRTISEEEFNQWSQAVKCAWYVWAKELHARNLVKTYGGLVLCTEDLSTEYTRVLDFFRIEDSEEVSRVASKRFNYTDGKSPNHEGKSEEQLYEEIESCWSECERVLSGEVL